MNFNDQGEKSSSQVVFKGSLDGFGDPFSVDDSDLISSLIDEGDPDPTPDPEPTPDPTPDPDPEPTLVNEGNPDPDPEPAPDPTPAPPSGNVWYQLAGALKDLKFFNDSHEFDESIEPEVFVDLLEKRSAERATQLSQDYAEELERVKQAKAEELGFTPENRRYLEYLLAGNDPAEITYAGQLKRLSQIPLEANEEKGLTKEAVDQNMKDLARAYFSYKGVDEDLIDSNIEALEAKGKLEEYSKKFSDFFKKEVQKVDDEIANSAAQERQRREKLEMEEKKSLQKVFVDNTTLNNYPIDKDLYDRTVKALYEKTETVEVPDGKGGTTKQHTTLMKKKMHEMSKDPVKRALMTILILNDFDFTPVMQKGGQVKNEELKNVLSRVGAVTGTNNPPPSSGKTDYNKQRLAFDKYANR